MINTGVEDDIDESRVREDQLWSEQDGPHGPASIFNADDFEPDTPQNLTSLIENEPTTLQVQQPETRSISQEQLVAEVKGIYAGLAMVESKCIEVDNDKVSGTPQKLNSEQWQALIALHRTLLHEHHDFFLASQHPNAIPALRMLASKYTMPARMWRHGIHSFLELLRQQLQASIEHMLTFIYLAYSMMAFLYETIPALEDTWIERLGDLGRYRMAIEDEDLLDREYWSRVSRQWYSEAADTAVANERLYHHLAILARPHPPQQLFYYPRTRDATFMLTPSNGLIDFEEGSNHNFSVLDEYTTYGTELKVEGTIAGTMILATADTGAERNIISSTLIESLGLSLIPGTSRSIQMGSGRFTRSLGIVNFLWVFKGESFSYSLECDVIPECIHDLILSGGFLLSTETMTTHFHRRVRRVARTLPTILRLGLIGNERLRIWGSLHGNFAAALPDSGSDVMLVSGEYARRHHLNIDPQSRLILEFPNGSTALTAGVIRDAPWTFGDTGITVNCNFYVLDGLPVDVVLSTQFLVRFNVFAEFGKYLFHVKSSTDATELCNIRLIGRYSEQLRILEDDYWSDLNSPDAFSRRGVDAELIRRDEIREAIENLPFEQQEEARRMEEERRIIWDEARLRFMRQRGLQPSSIHAGSSTQAPERQRHRVYGRFSRWRRRRYDSHRN